MKFHFKSIIIVSCSLQLLLSVPSFAQEKLVDNQLAQQKEIWYDWLVGYENSGIINGPEYFIPMQGSTTHPFYSTRELSLEWVVYKDQRYQVALMYDIYSDILILRHRDKDGIFVLIELEKKYVDSFTLYGHNFKKLPVVNSNDKKQTSMFFDILFDGEIVDLVARRKKTIYMIDSRPQYQYDDKFYYLKADRLTPLISKKSMYNTLDGYEQRKYIQDFVNKNRLNIKNENDLLQITKYYDSLIQVRSK